MLFYLFFALFYLKQLIKHVLVWYEMSAIVLGSILGVKLWKRVIQLKYEAVDVNKRLHIYMPVYNLLFCSKFYGIKEYTVKAIYHLYHHHHLRIKMFCEFE